jgi:hypothetical protein
MKVTYAFEIMHSDDEQVISKYKALKIIELTHWISQQSLLE